MDPNIPDDIVTLLRERVVSLERLETLLDLRREHARAWGSDEIATRVHIPVDMIDSALSELRSHGLVAWRIEDSSLHWRYAPASPELAAAVGRLAAFYDAHRVDVVRTLGALAIDRIRNSAARAFVFLRKSSYN